MVEVFPELAGVPIEYAWGGQVAFTLDQMPHAGRLDGVHYALGYGGHGVAMADLAGRAHGSGTGRTRLDPAAHRAVPAGAAVRWDAVVPAACGRVL